MTLTPTDSFVILCELTCILRKYGIMAFRCFLHGFEFRIVLFLGWIIYELTLRSSFLLNSPLLMNSE